MRADQRRPLVAYVLVSLACAFVVAPSLDLGGLPFGPKPSFSALSDTTVTPSEVANGIIDPTTFAELPDAELVEDPVTDDGDSFAPGMDAIVGGLVRPPFAADDTAVEDSPADSAPEAQSSTGGGTQPVAGPRSQLVGGGFAAGGGASSDGDHGGPAGPDATDGSGVFDGLPSSGGGPSTSPGADGGSGGGEEAAPGPEPGNGHGASAPAPHSFDDVPPGEHPYGHVGPTPGKGDKGHGPKDKGDKGKNSKDNSKD